MLPEIISNNLASLQPDRVRYTRTVFIEFTPEGARVDAEVRKSAIKSKRRFTYEEVDEYLADRQAWRDKAHARGVGAAGADARAGDDPPPSPVHARGDRAARCRS
jgi:exoribonuclease R